MKPFIPHNLPIKDLEWSELIEILGEANREIARYDGALPSIPNPQVLLAPLRTREAVLSSKIEGTQATLEEVLEFEAGSKKSSEKKSDITEVTNYRRALIFAIEEMETRPISLNMLKRIHRILLEGVRGENKDLGNFRRIQTWIGAPGSSMEQARFVPPAVPNMQDALGNFEKYIHHDDKDYLVQLAIVHAQFEIIHPFLDGNGRIGRILIPLFLFHKKVIHQPVFYMSDYLEANRKNYYDALKSISDKNDWSQWIKFFLNGLILQSRKNIDKTKKILRLYDDMKHTVVDVTHSQYAIHTIDCIFSNPVFNTIKFIEDAKVNKARAYRILSSLTDAGILTLIEKGSGRKPSVYSFRDLIKIINE